MAEGMLDGVLGDDEEDREASTEARPEAFAAAIAASLSRQNPEVAAETVVFLRKQTALLEAQRRAVEAEHEFFEVEWLPRLLGIRLRTGFQTLVALFAVVLAIGIALLIHDAVESRVVVIDSFDTPPSLIARGVTGKTVASELLDELTRLQEATRSTSAARGLTSAWSNNIKLEVPETGLSISDISRLLRDRFGHDVHIDGDLIETPTGDLALTVRGNGVPAKSFSGSVTKLDKLSASAAEYVYSKSQPGRWAGYLTQVNRNDEAIAFCRSAVASADPAERPEILSYWSDAIQNVGGSNREALALLRAALKLKPDFWVAHNNIQNALMMSGDEEGAWRDGEEMMNAAGGRPGRALETYYQNWDNLTWNLGAWLTGVVADAEANAGAGTNNFEAQPQIADIQARLHDPDGAELSLKTTQDTADPVNIALIHFVRGRLAANAGDATTAATELEAFEKAYAEPSISSNFPGYNCWIAPAEEVAGHPDRADALLKTGGTYVDCYRFRADILDGRSDWTGAQKAYSEAVALAPDLPAAYYSWGLALERHEDLDAAAAKFKDANHRGPHWADPLKAWGDVLAKQGKIKAALGRYDEALKFAPNWKQLHEARDATAKKKDLIRVLRSRHSRATS